MDDLNLYVVRANIDHYFRLLTSQALTGRDRDTIIKLMVAEENNLGHALEQLEFAETRVARSRDRVDHLRRLRDAFADGSTDRTQAEKLLENFEVIHQLMERFYDQMRKKVNSNTI